MRAISAQQSVFQTWQHDTEHRLRWSMQKYLNCIKIIAETPRCFSQWVQNQKIIPNEWMFGVSILNKHTHSKHKKKQQQMIRNIRKLLLYLWKSKCKFSILFTFSVVASQCITYSAHCFGHRAQRYRVKRI